MLNVKGLDLEDENDLFSDTGPRHKLSRASVKKEKKKCC